MSFTLAQMNHVYVGGVKVMDLTDRRFSDFDGDDSDHALVQRAVDATGQFFAGTFSFSRSFSGLYSGETSSPS